MLDFDGERLTGYSETIAPYASAAGHNPASHKHHKLLSEDERQAVLSAAHHNHLAVRTLGQSFRRLNPFPLQQLRADSLSDDLLEVADALRFDSLALRFLRFFLQAEIHRQRLLLGLLLGFDRGLERGGQLDVTEKHAFNDESALAEQTSKLVVDLLGDHLALAGVESIGGV